MRRTGTFKKAAKEVKDWASWRQKDLDFWKRKQTHQTWVSNPIWRTSICKSACHRLKELIIPCFSTRKYLNWVSDYTQWLSNNVSASQSYNQETEAARKVLKTSRMIGCTTRGRKWLKSLRFMVTIVWFDL